MYATLTMTSLSIIGSARLLVAVMVSADALGVQSNAVRDTENRMEIYFPRPEEQWPVDDDGTRLELSVRQVIMGEIKHARIKLDGTPISRQAALDLLAEAEGKAEEARRVLRDEPFCHKGVKYGTHAEVKTSLERHLQAKGFKPLEVAMYHGYRR